MIEGRHTEATHILSPRQLIAAQELQELLSRPDAHLIEAEAGIGSGKLEFSEPAILTVEKLRAERAVHDKSASASKWLRG